MYFQEQFSLVSDLKVKASIFYNFEAAVKPIRTLPLQIDMFGSWKAHSRSGYTIVLQ